MAIVSLYFYLCAIVAWIIRMQNASRALSRHEHRRLRDFSLHLFVLNGFLPVLGSLSAHRALLHRPQTGTCLQPVPHTGLWDNAFIVFQVEQHSAFVLF